MVSAPPTQRPTMRPTPYVYLPSPEKLRAFLSVLYRHGFTWAGYSEALAPIGHYPAAHFYAKAPKTVWVSTPQPSTRAHTSYPVIQLNSAHQLVSYMRETDRIGARHS